MGAKARGFWIGVTAGAFALFLSFLLRFLLGGLFVPELASQTLISLTPAAVESRAVETLGPVAKYSALFGVVFVNVAFYGVLGAFLESLRARLASKAYLTRAVGFSLVAYVILLLASVTFLGVTQISTQPISIQSAAAYLFPAQLVFGFALAYLYDSELRRPTMVQEVAPVALPRMNRRRRLLIVRPPRAPSSIILFYGLDLFFPSQQTPTESVTSPLRTQGNLRGPNACPVRRVGSNHERAILPGGRERLSPRR